MIRTEQYEDKRDRTHCRQLENQVCQNGAEQAVFETGRESAKETLLQCPMITDTMFCAG